MVELNEQQEKLADLILLIGTNLGNGLEDRGYVVRILDSSANFSGPSDIFTLIYKGSPLYASVSPWCTRISFFPSKVLSSLSICLNSWPYLFKGSINPLSAT